jgi:hypothetical protein
MKVKINNELVDVFEIVDIDYDDRRIYVKTHANSEVFCIPFADVFPSDENPLLARCAAILAAFEDEPLNKAEAGELLTELAEIDQALQFHPSDTCDAVIKAQWDKMEEIPVYELDTVTIPNLGTFLTYKGLEKLAKGK